MNRIEQITDNPVQKNTFLLPDGTQITMSYRFSPQQYGWFITELTYLDFTLKGFRISVSPNMFNQFRNRIPFGLGCFSKDNREPTLQQDFSSGAAKLFLLTEDECDEFARVLSGQVSS